MRSTTRSTKKPTRQTKSTKSAKRPSQSRARTGSGGLRSKSVFNWARALPIILILAVTGGFMVYRSYAGSAEDVAAIYLEVLGRDPDTAGWFYWTDKVNHGTSLSEVRAALQGSVEKKQQTTTTSKTAAPQQNQTTTPPATGGSSGGSSAPATGTSHRDQVRQAYQQVFCREPDAGGWDYWAGEMAKGQSYAKIVERMQGERAKSGASGNCSGGSGSGAVAQASAKAQAKAQGLPTESAGGHPIPGLDCVPGAGDGPAKVGLKYSHQNFIEKQCNLRVNEIFNQLLGRAPTANERDFWAKALFSEDRTREWVRAQIKGTDEYRDYEAKLKQQGGKVVEVAKADGVDNETLALRICSVSMGYNCTKTTSWAKDILAELNKGAKAEDLYARYAQSAYGGDPDQRKRRENNAPSGKIVPNQWSNQAWSLFHEMGGTRSMCPAEYDGYVNGTSQNFGHHGCLAAVGAYDSDLLRAYNNGEVSWADVAAYVQGAPRGASMRCTAELAAAIPECGGGALGVSKATVDSILVDKQKEQEALRNQAKDAGKSTAGQKPVNIGQAAGIGGNSKTITSPIDAALALTTSAGQLPVPDSLQATALTQKVLAKSTEIESEVLNSITFSTCYDPKLNLSIGDAGPCVSYIQQALVLANNDSQIAASGFYDEATAAAVTEFQDKHGIQGSESGRVDYDTVVTLSHAIFPKKHYSPYAPAPGTLVNSR